MTQLQTIGNEKRNKTIIAGAMMGSARDFDKSMKELENLAEACEMEVIASVSQNLASVTPAYYIGSGKVTEIKEMAEQLGADSVVFNNDLSPSQLTNLQKALDLEVLDRTNLILEIFSRRAKTREAKLQVEAANLQYILPRLAGMRSNLNRQGGTSGSLSNRGAGEKKLELDRRKIESRIGELEKELEAVQKNRETQRKRRSRSALPQIALVGYTNAGKSSLMNKMVEVYQKEEDKMVEAKDMLFATLDTTVRKITPGDNKDFLLSDTVGFISRLPHSLVKAFRSTLDEVRYADLLLEVVDFSDEQYKEHMEVTANTLKELGAEAVPRLYVMNKADLVMDETKLPKVVGDKIYMSAKTGAGLTKLLEMIHGKVFADYKVCEFLVPYEDGSAVSYLNGSARVLKQEYLPEGVRILAECRQYDAERYECYR